MKKEAEVFISGFALNANPDWVVNELKKLGHTDIKEQLCIVEYFKNLTVEDWIDIANDTFKGKSYEDFKISRNR